MSGSPQPIAREGSTRAYLRTLLILGRSSNLPTVWSNCLVGWWLGGGGDLLPLLLVILGGSSLYIGGMFLNDAFDAGFDRQFKKDRPIAAGAITELEVWQWGWGWMLAGLVPCFLVGRLPGILAIALGAVIIAYNAWHKQVSWSPILMAACRVVLVLVAAASGSGGITGPALWSALVLGLYIVGLSHIARRETMGGVLRWWPLACLLAPCFLSLLLNGPGFRAKAMLICTLLVAWVARSVFLIYGRERPQIGAAVSGLLAGIVLVDLLAVFPLQPMLVVPLLACFLLTLAAQRHIPAT